MVDPRILCRKHLLGEHGELHKHRHNFVKGHRMAGRVAGNAIEPSRMAERHDLLAAEMVRRGYRHESPYAQPDLSAYGSEVREALVDVSASLALLVSRCEDCRERARQAGLICKLCGVVMDGRDADTIDCGGDCSKCIREIEAQCKSA